MEPMALISKRLFIWLLETSFEALLLTLFLTVFAGIDRGDLAKELAVFAGGITLIFFTSGYLLTTVIFRAFWKNSRFWTYPGIAAMLFLIHFEIVNLEAGGFFSAGDRLVVRVAGVCIVLACTLVGSCILTKRTNTDAPLKAAGHARLETTNPGL